MKYAGIKVATVLLLVVVPQPPGKTETTARVSARITLNLPANVSLTSDPSKRNDLLCLNHMPAQSYHLFVRGIDQPPSADMQLLGKPGNHCISLPGAPAGKLVFIVAE